jgi:cyclin-D1-binding protein 1
MSGNSAKNAALGASLASSFVTELKALEIPAEVPEGAPMSQLHLAADAVNMNATKTQMLFSDGNGVDATAAAAALKELHLVVMGFVAHAQAALGTQGKTFDAAVKAASTTLSRACGNLIKVATENETRSEWLKPALAEVYEAVKAVKQLPKDGRAAVAKAMLKAATIVKDVSNELSELGSGGGFFRADDADADADDDDDAAAATAVVDEDDLLFGDDDFSEAEMMIAKQCASFASASFDFVKAVLGPTVRGPSASASDAAALERALERCEAFRREVEEIGAGVYPPQDVADIVHRAGGALEAARGMASAVEEAGGASGETKDAVDAFEGAVEALRDATGSEVEAA